MILFHFSLIYLLYHLFHVRSEHTSDILPATFVMIVSTVFILTYTCIVIWIIIPKKTFYLHRQIFSYNVLSVSLSSHVIYIYVIFKISEGNSVLLMYSHEICYFMFINHNLSGIFSQLQFYSFRNIIFESYISRYLHLLARVFLALCFVYMFLNSRISSLVLTIRLIDP